jgi:hypothetical protein
VEREYEGVHEDARRGHGVAAPDEGGVVMAYGSLDAEPDAYVITVDGQLLTEAGNNGAIAKFDVADQIRKALAAQCPMKSVDVFGFFKVHYRGRNMEKP